MKYILGLFLSLLVVCCQKNINNHPTPTKESLEKAEKFANNEAQTKKGHSFVVLDLFDIEYNPSLVQEITLILQSNRGDLIKGIKAMDNLIETKIISNNSVLDAQQKSDLQLTTFSAFRMFIFNSKDEIASQYSSRFLERLMKHTEPVEYKIIADAILLADTNLSASVKKEYFQYIKRKSIPDQAKTRILEEDLDRLKREKEDAMARIEVLLR